MRGLLGIGIAGSGGAAEPGGGGDAHPSRRAADCLPRPRRCPPAAAARAGGIRCSGAVRLRPPGAVLRADATRAGDGAAAAASARPRRGSGLAVRRLPCAARRADRLARPRRTADRLDDGARRLAVGAGGAGRPGRRRTAAAAAGRRPAGVDAAAGVGRAGGGGPPDSWPVEPVEARARLVRMLGGDAEPRPQQLHYASHVAAAFSPRQKAGEPRVVLAEAGTGVGKTLGYIAPATLWAQKNRGSVWISTYTRNLQRQLDQELDRAYPDLRVKSRKVVVRKGRENLFCLLNFEEASAQLSMRREDAVALGLVARWALASRDGDMVGGDFPAWLADLLGKGLTRRPHRHPRRVHLRRLPALSPLLRRALDPPGAAGRDRRRQPCAGDGAGGRRRGRDRCCRCATSSTRATSFSMRPTTRFLCTSAAARRPICGAGCAGRRRARGSGDGGLKERAGELRAGGPCRGRRARRRPDLRPQRCPGQAGGRGWLVGSALGPAEAFLVLVRQQVYARARNGDAAFSLEADIRPPIPGLIEAAAALSDALLLIARPLQTLVQALESRLDDAAETLETVLRQRIESLCRSIRRRGTEPLAGWRAMLRSMAQAAPAGVPRLAGGGAGGGARDRRGLLPSLDRPDAALRRDGAAAGARRA